MEEFRIVWGYQLFKDKSNKEEISNKIDEFRNLHLLMKNNFSIQMNELSLILSSPEELKEKSSNLKDSLFSKRLELEYLNKQINEIDNLVSNEIRVQVESTSKEVALKIRSLKAKTSEIKNELKKKKSTVADFSLFKANYDLNLNMKCNFLIKKTQDLIGEPSSTRSLKNLISLNQRLKMLESLFLRILEKKSSE